MTIRISHIYITDNKLIITIPDRIKTSASGRSQPLLTFSRFLDGPDLCIIITIMEYYLRCTRDLRVPDSNFLFISYVKPYRVVRVQTISRWIQRGLEECGIQSDLFSAHSTRYASTSLAAKKGVSLDIIKRAAGWSGESSLCEFL